jgi:hypothetical protein
VGKVLRSLRKFHLLEENLGVDMVVINIWFPWLFLFQGGQFAKQQKYESSPNVKGKKSTKKRKHLELREDAPEADSPPRSVPRLLPEGNTLSSVSHAHRKLAEVSNALSTPPKHRLSSAAAAVVTTPKSTKKKLKAPEHGVPMTRQQSAADSDEHQRPMNPMLPTSRVCFLTMFVHEDLSITKEQEARSVSVLHWLFPDSEFEDFLRLGVLHMG